MPRKKTKKTRRKKEKTHYEFVVIKGKRYMFTWAEMNRAWLRSKKRSGLG